MRSLQHQSEEYVKLQALVQGQRDGTLLTYDSVTKSTSIPMTRANRDKLRRVILRSGRRYIAFPSVGYELAKAETVMPILVYGLRRIDGQVKRVDKSERLLRERFFNQLPSGQQKAVLFLGAVFGAIRLAAEQGKELYSQKKLKEITTSQPIMPNNL